MSYTFRQRAAAGVGALMLVTTALAFAQGEMTEGEIRKVDRDAAKLTIRHGEIRNLQMPPMTMVFRVKDAAMLDQVKEGDKVRFSADKVGGQYTVTGIEAAK